MNTRLVTLGLALLALSFLAACNCCSPRSKSETVELFDGKTLDGWNHVLADATVPRDRVWSVREGMIVCQGTPLGHLHTTRAFTNFRLRIEYRWAPGAKPGNSGIFSRISGTPRALPRAVEVQLMHDSAGDLLTLQGMKLGPGQPRYFHVDKHELAGDIDGVKKLTDAEKPPGEWNQVEILAQADRYTVWVNGQQVNEATGVAVLAGPIGLQSEGGEIHFRRISLTPLP